LESDSALLKHRPETQDNTKNKLMMKTTARFNWRLA
jgi:hypothetical protein